ncbi:MAG: Cytochrome c4 [Burkholderiaceae bacterium]|nr:MAG: Cytochrome c4 [Burkholderiaceae bacterium]
MKPRLRCGWLAPLGLVALLAGCAKAPGPVAPAGGGVESNIAPVKLAHTVCATCHGFDGNSGSPQFPKLAGQQREYLVAQLTDFKGHARADITGQQFMWGFTHLSQEQIDGLADYFSSQTPMKGHGTPSGERGAMLFQQGSPTAGVPACVSCHGAQGEGRGQFPRLAGQHADYVYKQLKVFQTTEDRPRGAPMRVVAHNLTDADARALAQYISTLGQ